MRAASAELKEEGEISVSFEGRRLMCRRGETLAAALTASGERELRETRKGERRGVFCGMGVCQECLVEVDGRPCRRACMTKVTGPSVVRRQRFPPAALASEEPRAALGTKALEPDILVIGAGAAGLAAAATAARIGARVLLIDERPELGGQFYKQPVHPSIIGDDRQFADGRALIAEAQAGGLDILKSAQAWGAFEPLELLVSDGAATRICRPRQLIVATGAYERGVPVPGWTLPGVMTTGAAQTLLRSYGVLPGKRVLVAGNGPLNLQVALELSRAGADVAAVAELAPRPALRRLPAALRMLTSTPGLALAGIAYLASLRTRGIPVHYGHVLRRIERAGDRLVARLSGWPEESIVTVYDVDTVLMGYGFMPSNELLRGLGCRFSYDPARGHLVAERDADCRTSVEGIYAVGDCAGLGGARAAEAEGRIAGLAAARSLGYESSAELAVRDSRARGALLRHRRFQAGLWTLFAARRPLLDLATADTIVCRCEEVTLAELEAGLAGGAEGVSSIKRATRIGMGACQGRYCGPLVAALTAEREGRPLDEFSHWAPRPPVKPIAIADIVRGG